MAQTVPVFLCLDFSSNPTRPPADVPPRLRRRPHTGALNQSLLLLGIGAPHLTATAQSTEKGNSQWARAPFPLLAMPQLKVLRSLNLEEAVYGIFPPKGGCRAAAGGTHLKGWRVGLDYNSKTANLKAAEGLDQNLSTKKAPGCSSTRGPFGCYRLMS